MGTRRTARAGHGQRRNEPNGDAPGDDEAYDDNDLDEDGFDDDDLDDDGFDDEAPYEVGEGGRRARGGRDVDRAVLSPALAARAGMQHVANLTGKEPSGVTSVEPTDDGWLIGVEVIESRRIPSSIDLLGLYMTQVSVDGSLVTYRRTRRYPRGRGDSSEVI